MNEEKFSGKAEIYDKYRPTYPTALINVLYNEIHGDENSRVADIAQERAYLQRHFSENSAM